MLTESEFNNSQARFNYNNYDDYMNQMNTTQGGNEFSLMDYLPFGDKSIGGSIMKGIGNFIPERDPRQTALNQFYDVNNGTIQSGLMEGYNPVSGGLLNTMTGGRFGDSTNYGLQNAYQKRMDTINNTLDRRTQKALAQNQVYNFDDTQLDERLTTLRGMRDDEQKFVANQIGQNYTGDQDMDNVVDNTGRRDATGGAGITAQDQFSNKTGRGRTGYFFGGRVNYKVGGRTDAGPNRTTASHSTRGQINESGQQVSGGQTTRDNNGGNDSPTFYSPPNRTETLYENTIFGNVPAGLTRDMNIGRLSAMLNLNKLKDEELEGKMQFDSSIGPVNTTTSYDTITGPEFNANYIRDNFDVGVNSKTGLSANYSKDIGPGTFTAGGTYKPDGTFNTEGKYVISFANGGLASIL